MRYIYHLCKGRGTLAEWYDMTEAEIMLWWKIHLGETEREAKAIERAQKNRKRKT